MATVRYAHATRQFPGNDIPAVDDLNLDIEDGEFMVLVGPSGSGKSTALRMLAGLEQLDSGSVEIGGVDVSTRSPKDRDIAMVFQNYALYPHMSVAENMGFALKLAGVPKAERMERVRNAAKLLDLDTLLDRRPKTLSGGQRQRIAMGRAIVREPSVFLMDEPLSNLDAKLRVETRANIAALQARLGTTTVYVTHDQVEAMTMGHRVAVLDHGKLQQVDTPRKLYDFPCSAFVAGFIGSPAMNLRTATMTPDGASLDGTKFRILRGDRPVDSTVIVGIRPEALVPSIRATDLALHVNLVEELGSDTFVYGSLRGDLSPRDKPFVVRWEGPSPSIGDDLFLMLKPDAMVHFFDGDTGLRIG
jgi:multiple sugar transport system ATP-binding protein